MPRPAGNFWLFYFNHDFARLNGGAGGGDLGAMTLSAEAIAELNLKDSVHHSALIFRQ